MINHEFFNGEWKIFFYQFEQLNTHKKLYKEYFSMKNMK